MVADHKLVSPITHADRARTIIDQDNIARTLHVWDTNFIGVIPSDQYTRPIDFTFAQVVFNGISLASTPTIGSYNITLTAGHGLIGGESISIYEIIGTDRRFWAGRVLSIVDNVATVDTPINYAFVPSTVALFKRSPEMNIDGSSTTEIFTIVNPSDISIDITRVNFHLRDATDMDDALFGGMSALTRGIVFRKKISENEYHNFWNIKTNGNFGLLGTKTYQDKAPSGEYGMQVRVTYAGMERHGVAIRLDPGQALEILIQDALQNLTFFRAVAQGHLTR